MLKRTITYTDYNDVEREEDFYFNLTQAEITRMEMEKLGGLERHLQTIIRAKDAPAIMESFRYILRKAYGKKTPDGRRFMKSEEISDEFEQTEAYSILFMELCTDPDKASAFVEGIMPKVDGKKPLPAPTNA